MPEKRQCFHIVCSASPPEVVMQVMMPDQYLLSVAVLMIGASSMLYSLVRFGSQFIKALLVPLEIWLAIPLKCSHSSGSVLCTHQRFTRPCLVLSSHHSHFCALSTFMFVKHQSKPLAQKQLLPVVGHICECPLLQTHCCKRLSHSAYAFHCGHHWHTR